MRPFSSTSLRIWAWAGEGERRKEATRRASAVRAGREEGRRRNRAQPRVAAPPGRSTRLCGAGSATGPSLGASGTGAQTGLSVLLAADVFCGVMIPVWARLNWLGKGNPAEGARHVLGVSGECISRQKPSGALEIIAFVRRSRTPHRWPCPGHLCPFRQPRPNRAFRRPIRPPAWPPLG